MNILDTSSPIQIIVLSKGRKISPCPVLQPFDETSSEIDFCGATLKQRKISTVHGKCIWKEWQSCIRWKYDEKQLFLKPEIFFEFLSLSILIDQVECWEVEKLKNDTSWKLEI